MLVPVAVILIGCGEGSFTNTTWSVGDTSAVMLVNGVTVTATVPLVAVPQVGLPV